MKFKNFLMLGLTAIISVNALAAPLTNTEQGIEQLSQKVQHLQEQNVLPKVPINFIIKATSEVNKIRVNAMATLNLNKEACSVDVDVTPDMHISHSGTDTNREFLKDVTGSSNAIQHKLRTEYIVYHESSHCKMYEIKDVFKHDNAEVQNYLNKYFKFSGNIYSESENGDSSLYFMLHENFADSMAFIHMLKANGPTKDVLETMQKIQIERSDAAHTNNKTGMIFHNTEFALKEILKEENIKKILATDDPAQLQELALKFANKGLWESVATHAKHVTQVMNMESIENGVKYFVLNSIKSGPDKLDTLEKNVNVSLENTVLPEIAKNVKVNLEKEFGPLEFKNSEELYKFWSKNIDGILQIISDASYDYISKNEKINVLEFLGDNITPTLKTTNKVKTVEQVKEDGINDLKHVEQVINNLNTKSTLSKLAELRAKNENQNKSVITLKFGSN